MLRRQRRRSANMTDFTFFGGISTGFEYEKGPGLREVIPLSFCLVRRLAESVQVVGGSHVKLVFANRRGGENLLVEVVLRQDFECIFSLNDCDDTANGGNDYLVARGDG